MAQLTAGIYDIVGNGRTALNPLRPALVKKHPAHDAVGCTAFTTKFNAFHRTQARKLKSLFSLSEATSIPDDIRAAAAQLIGEGRVEVQGAVCLNASLEITASTGRLSWLNACRRDRCDC